MNGFIKLTKTCTINGRTYSIGDTIQVSVDTARQLFGQRAAVPAGDAKNKRGERHMTRSAEGSFRALRGFYLDGQLIQRESIVQLSDRHIITDLLNARRIEPADAETRARLNGEPTLRFEEISEHLRQQAMPNRVVGFAGRR